MLGIINKFVFLKIYTFRVVYLWFFFNLILQQYSKYKEDCAGPKRGLGLIKLTGTLARNEVINIPTATAVYQAVLLNYFRKIKKTFNAI